MAQAQNIWSLGLMSLIQWICRELVKELSHNELNTASIKSCGDQTQSKDTYLSNLPSEEVKSVYDDWSQISE